MSSDNLTPKELEDQQTMSRMYSKVFHRRIDAMNKMYKLPANSIPIMPADTASRLTKFKKTLLDEVNEIDEIIAAASVIHETIEQQDEARLEIAVAIADLLGDITVYCRSEALKYGIPLEDVLSIIMDSNESKLGADGQPIYNEDGKFLKGPSYFKPEPAIKKLLQAGSGVQQGTW